MKGNHTAALGNGAAGNAAKSLELGEGLVVANLAQETKLPGDARVRARRFNNFGKIIYVLIVVAFNIIFWVIAVRVYLMPPEKYLNEENWI